MIAIYARQSIDKVDSISIETQIDLCKSMVDTKAEAVAVYQDKGYSGSNTNRPGFIEMMKDIKSRKVTKVLSYKLDRISRSLSDFIKMMDVFTEHGVEFASKSESFDTSTPFGRAMLQICMVFAQLERENTIMRVTDAYASRSTQGFYMGGRVPYGFSLKDAKLNGKKTSMYEPVLEEIDDIRIIFDLYSKEKTSLNDIVKYLLANDITNKRGGKWVSARISDILRNPCYVKADADVYNFFKLYDTVIANDITEFNGTHAAFMFGRREHGKKFSNLNSQTLVLALHEGVIDADTWLKCQYKLKRNQQIKRGTSKVSWLTGLVKCGNCGYSMRVVKANTRAGRYFNCSGKSDYHICKGQNRTLYADHIENIIEKAIGEKLQHYKLARKKKSVSNDSQINSLKINLIAIEEEIEKLMKKLADANDTLFGYINNRVSKLDTQKVDILRKIEEMKLAQPDTAPIINIDEAWKNPTYDNKKSVAHLLIEKIVISDTDIQIIWKI